MTAVDNGHQASPEVVDDVELLPAPVADAATLLAAARAAMRTRDFFVEPWETTVRLRGLSKAQEQQLRAKADEIAKVTGATLDETLTSPDVLERLMFQACVVDAAANPLFAYDQVIELFASGTSAGVNLVLNAIFELNGVRNEEQEKAKETSFRS